MKKYMAGMMCAALVMGLCACGNSSADSAVGSVSEAPSAAEDTPADDVKAEIEENILKAVEARDAGNYVEAEQYMQIVSEKSLAAYPAYSEGEDDPLLQWGTIVYSNIYDIYPTALSNEAVLCSVSVLQNGVKKETCLDENGEQEPVSVITYYGDGKIKEEEWYDAKEKVLRQKKQYDTAGNLLEQIQYTDDAQPGWHRELIWDENRKLTKEIDYDGTRVTNVYEYVYGENGHVQEEQETNYLSETQTTATRTVWTYDDKDYWQTQIVYDAQGNVWKTYEAQNTYDANGRVTDHMEYITDDSHTNSLAYRETTTYDENGNVLSEIKQDLIAAGQFYSRKEYTYDENGNIINELQYDESGTVIWQAKHEYNNGRKTLIESKSQSSEDGTQERILYYYAPKEILEKLGML